MNVREHEFRSTPMNDRTDDQAVRNAEHDALVHQRAENAAAHSDVYHNATHPAATGTGVGDNRDDTGDPEKAATLGAVGGAVVGAAAGSLLGPAGAVLGAVGGALAAAGASGLAVDAVDQVDNDNTASGMDDGTIHIPDDDTRNTNTPAPMV
jgi:outer membrane lipoprotein SlyB